MRHFLFLIILSLLSCAKPNYIEPTELTRSGNPTMTACPFYFQEERLCLSYRWNQFPSEESFGSFTMKFFAEENPTAYISPKLSPSVKLWMPSMGHGSSPVIIKMVSDGIYEVTDVYFTMLGEWEIRFQLKNNDEVIEEKIQKITI